ncbi:MAG: zinc-ribbon domain-containing protein, partial [Deltaproteobacteria bacterium]|nr:zinc-ribbon domain-containing protein [Deltaproteobacteria bacterium]
MIIQCENCKRNFRLEDSRINPPGSSVRCSKCGHIFFVSKTKELSNEATLEISQETPLFEDLKEEIVTEEKSNDYPEKEEPLSGSSSDLTQAELSIRKDTDETDSDIVDLPTEHDQSLEELIDKEVSEVNKADLQIDKTQTLEIQETDSHINDINIDQEPADSTPASPELFEAEDGEEDFGESHNRSHNRKTSYTSSETIVQKSGAGIFAKIIYTLITITALFVIFIASLVILINADILPKGTLLSLTTLVESIIPIELKNTEIKEVIITEHRGRWMNTVNGPIYIVSGLITNESQAPVHYVRLKSEYIAAEKIQFDDIFYAGNTFTDNELKVSPIGKILSKLKQKNGDIDVNNS